MVISVIFIGFGMLAVFPDTADAKRMGGGSSMGSRGSKSSSAPQAASPRDSSTPSSSFNSQNPGGMGAARGGMFGGMSSGLLGGLGGFMLGGMLGSMLFGGAGAGMGGAGGGGIGLLEILLIGGGIWFFMRWIKRQRAMTPAGYPGSALPQGNLNFPGRGTDMPNHARDNHAREEGSRGLPNTFNIGGRTEVVDEVSQGVKHIASMDPNFNESQFIHGAKLAFQQMQKSWSDGNSDSLRPLLTPAMMERVHADLKERQSANLKDCIENVQFQQAAISEAWQESGEDWITVHFHVSMLDYSTDHRGVVVEGSRTIAVDVEEYWTFTRPVGSRDPNWFLAAIQQPGQALNHG
ncbi:MAG TPA: Tim44 domain-containing protein [Magnetococcales bacterium]|nr:Tim44 domain-containing protein [Magnetococcales bacterium]